MRAVALGLALLALGVGCGTSGSAYRGSDPLVRSWFATQHLPAAAAPGAELFRTAGCLLCHAYPGSGPRDYGPYRLGAVGTRQLGIGYEVRHLAVFLEASKGPA